MHRIVRAIAALSVASLMVLAVAIPAAAGSTDRPFKGSVAGIGWVVPDTGCPSGTRTMTEASGEVTHLGLVTVTGSHCTPVGLDIVGGVETVVAANGDTLEMTYTASVEPFDLVDGASMTGPGHHVITGGTGRFVGADGEFDDVMHGILHLATPMNLSWTWDGRIGY